MPSRDAITIIAPRGLGDACVCLPACYTYHEQGYRVNMLNRGAVNFAATLPTLVPIGTEQEGEVLDISMGLSFHSHMRMLAQVSLRLGVYPLAIPDGPWLQIPDEYPAMVSALGVPEEYVLVCPRGSQAGREMTPEQVAAVADEWPTVVVHDRPLEGFPGLDLTGKTSLPELYALTACAQAVVSVDTGVMHLAGAFHTPMLGVIGNTLNPYSFCEDYVPSLWLKGVHSFTVDPEYIADGLGQLLEEVDGCA
jgi:ADP-heptose:LPS heptosyltransferase